MATYLDQSLAELERFEGSIPWMYRDTAGKVTVGVGMMLPDSKAACALPFTIAGTAASSHQIEEEYERVAALPMGRPAVFYRADQKPELPQSEIAALLRKVLTGFEEELRTHLPAYDTFPDGVKLALLDMAYNLGPVGLLHGFPRMMRAVAAQNWAEAAAACFRRGPSAARNAWTRQMFLSSVIASVRADAESGLARLGFGLVGLAAGAAEFLHRKWRAR